MIENFRYSEKPSFGVKSRISEIPIFLRIFKADSVRAIDTLVAEHIANMLSLVKWTCK